MNELRVVPMTVDSLYFRDYASAAPKPCFIELNCVRQTLYAHSSMTKSADLLPHVFRWSIPILNRTAALWLMESIRADAENLCQQYRDGALTVEGCRTEMRIADFISTMRWGWADVDPRDDSIRDTDPSSLRFPTDDTVYLKDWMPILHQLKRAVENKDWEPLVKAYESLPPKALEIFNAADASHHQA